MSWCVSPVMAYRVVTGACRKVPVGGDGRGCESAVVSMPATLAGLSTLSRLSPLPHCVHSRPISDCSGDVRRESRRAANAQQLVTRAAVVTAEE